MVIVKGFARTTRSGSQRPNRQYESAAKDESFAAFSLIVDINGFTRMVRNSNQVSIAHFVRDLLSGSVAAIEEAGGDVVEVMGDAILGILPDADAAAGACFEIARDLNAQGGYAALALASGPGSWEALPSRPSLKIGIEYGRLDVSAISSRLLGVHPLIIGEPINHVARILSVGHGNRCLVGPRAREQGFSNYPMSGPYYVKGKAEEPDFEYYQLDLGDIWNEDVGESGFRNRSCTLPAQRQFADERARSSAQIRAGSAAPIILS